MSNFKWLMIGMSFLLGAVFAPKEIHWVQASMLAGAASVAMSGLTLRLSQATSNIERYARHDRLFWVWVGSLFVFVLLIIIFAQEPKTAEYIAILCIACLTAIIE